jgi:uncharacterized DUF497 family protein
MEDMEFTWDERKNATNERKHGISFEDAKPVFLDPARVGWLHSDPGDDEERFIVIGRSSWKIMAVIYTMRGNVTRLISARKASRREQREYHQS